MIPSVAVLLFLTFMGHGTAERTLDIPLPDKFSSLPSSKVRYRYDLNSPPQDSKFFGAEKHCTIGKWLVSNIIFEDATNNVTIAYCSGPKTTYTMDAFIIEVGRIPYALRDLEIQFAGVEEGSLNGGRGVPGKHSSDFQVLCDDADFGILLVVWIPPNLKLC